MNHRMITLFKNVVLITIILFSTLNSFSQSHNFEVVKGLELMDLIYQNLDVHFVDEPKPGKLSKVAIDAMLKELDPYTVYYHEANMEDYRMMTTGQYGGIGALIRKMGDYICISEPYEGNPAQKSGLRAGDKILEIDGKNMVKKPSEEVSQALKGPKGTTIQVKVLRNEKEQVVIPITRDEIKIPDVPYAEIISNGVGYIKLNSFTQTASEEVKKAFLDLKSKGMNQLVFDLRDNGGGLLIEAVKIVNFFVPKDKIVVTTKGRIKEENQIYKTQFDPLDTEIPVVVLIDEGSASASEIVSGSLQDLDRAVIVGQTSFGKGLVQRTFDLKYGSKIKLTIAKYYTPSGRCVQKLEYYDKNEDERPKEIPDSLIRKFKTVNGREVIDGRGIEPDVKVQQKEFSRLTAMLVAKNFIFNYATDYHKTHSTIAPANTFKLTDNEFNQFKDLVIKDTFDYSTASEEVLKKMRKTAEAEGYFEDSKAEYEALFKRVTPSKQRDLEKFSSEIKELIENEIVSRYYYQKGRTEHAFRDDVFIDKAKEILQNKTTYNTILKK
jgi:carboxyl-terminal processing protease